MKNIKYLAVALLAFVGVTSCDQDNIGAIYTPKADNVSFELASASAMTSETNYSAEIILNRNVTNKEYAAHVELVSVSAEGVFSIANEGVVKFEKGDASSILKLDAVNLEKGSTYTAVLALSEADAAVADTILGNAVDTCTFILTCDFNWIPAGKGIFTDVNATYEESASAEVEVIHGDGSNVYRLVQPYATVFSEVEGVEIRGVDLEFTVDNGKFNLKPGNYSFDLDGYFGAAYGLYYDPARYPQYCYTEQEGDMVTVTYIISENKSPAYVGYVFTFEWTNESALK